MVELRNKELLTELCDMLNKREVWHTNSKHLRQEGHTKIWTLEDDRFEQLQYLPPENLREAISITSSLKCGTLELQYVLTQWAVGKVFSMTPYPIEGTSTYVLSCDKYLHLFRNQHYQISNYASGLYTAEQGSFSINDLLKESRYIEEEGREDDLYAMLWYASLIECAYDNANFRRWVEREGDEVVTEVLRNTLAESNSNYPLVSWEYLRRNYIRYGVEEVNPVDDNVIVYQSEIKDGLLCRICVNKDARQIIIESKESTRDWTTLTLWVPKSSRYFDLSNCFYKAGDFWGLLLNMALRLCNIKANWMVMYSLSEKHQPLRKLNIRNAVNVGNLNAIKL